MFKASCHAYDSVAVVHEVPLAWNAFLSSVLPHLLKDHPSRSIANVAATNETFPDLMRLALLCSFCFFHKGKLSIIDINLMINY